MLGGDKMLTANYNALAILLLIITMSPTSNQFPVRRPRSAHLSHEVTFETDGTTEQTGSIIMQCRNEISENIPLSHEVKFWLNWTNPHDPNASTSLQERGDFNVVKVDPYRIKFNLTRGLEGNYTCGQRVNESYVQMSQPKTIICKLISLKVHF